MLRVFERRVLRRTCDPIFENGEWGKRYNNELDEILQESNVIMLIRLTNSDGQDRGMNGSIIWEV